MSGFTHVELNELILKKDYEKACEDLHKNYRWLVHKLVTGFVKSQNLPFSSCEDLSQSAFTNICRQISFLCVNKETLKDSLPGYVSTITKNVCINYLNVAKRRRFENVDDIHESQIITPSKSKNPEEIFEKQQKRELIDSNLCKLPEIDRRIIRLYTEGDSWEQISKKVGLSITNARIRFFRAKIKLKEAFDGL